MSTTSEMTYLGICTDYVLVDMTRLYPVAHDIKAWVSDDGLFQTAVAIPVVGEDDAGTASFTGTAHVTSRGLHDRLRDSLDALAESASEFLDSAWTVGRVGDEVRHAA